MELHFHANDYTRMLRILVSQGRRHSLLVVVLHCCGCDAWGQYTASTIPFSRYRPPHRLVRSHNSSYHLHQQVLLLLMLHKGHHHCLLGVLLQKHSYWHHSIFCVKRVWPSNWPWERNCRCVCNQRSCLQNFPKVVVRTEQSETGYETWICELGKKTFVNLDVEVNERWVSPTQKSKLNHESTSSSTWKLGNLDWFIFCLDTASALLLAQPSIWEVLVMTLDLVLYRMTTVSVSKFYCKWA